MNLRKPKPEYFRVKEKYINHCGDKYFSLLNGSERVVVICFSYGNTKQGKNISFGMYTISKSSFDVYYNRMKHLEYISFNQFKSATRLMVNKLNNYFDEKVIIPNPHISRC